MNTAAFMRRRGVTLVEMTLAIVILAIVAGSSLPVIHGAVDAYAGAAETRSACERGGYAIEKIERLLKDAPAGSAPGTVGVTTLDASGLVLTSEQGFVLEGNVLYWLEAGGVRSVLCEDVSEFRVVGIGDDGVTEATGADIRRFHVYLTTGGFSLRTAVFPRAVAEGGGA